MGFYRAGARPIGAAGFRPKGAGRIGGRPSSLLQAAGGPSGAPLQGADTAPLLGADGAPLLAKAN